MTGEGPIGYPRYADWMALAFLPMPQLSHDSDPEPATQTLVVRDGEISIRIVDAGLACCAVEVAAALRGWAARPFDAAGGSGAGDVAGRAGRVNLLVVAGTVTDKLAPHVLRAYREMPEPRRVISFGACSNSGGPYWDSYCVTKGTDQLIPVDVYVPGCPPRPEAFVHALESLL